MHTHAATKESGFTILEVMVAMSVFLVLVTAGIGAVLTAMAQHRATQNLRTAMDNLSFVMEDMARNIRLGSNVYCGTADPTFGPGGAVTPGDCPGGLNRIVFNDLRGNHVTYTISVPSATLPFSPNAIYKRIGDVPGTDEQISAQEITIDFARSGFTVRGSVPGDGSQPSVVIRLAGKVTYRNIESPFAVETTVTLRALDS